MGKWNVQHLSDLLEAWGLWGHFLGALLAFVQPVVPFMPFVVVAGVNVLVFGLWFGFVVNYVMAVLGAITEFWLARNYGRTWVEKKIANHVYIQKFNKQIEHHGFIYITISRIIPVIPSFGINLGAAVMRVKTMDFVLGTIVGKLPMILLESFIGHDLLHFQHNKKRLLIMLGIFVILLLVGHICKKKWLGSDERT
ncbi:TVP38/TMEM64 family protein [Paenibacillus sp. FSL H8-0034]|uniref:TVP38/TMEM64 family protein n=1 Tax=Paenibacillus sp. FSL H8-0034 TaxID=2954671 RepID=UPI0030F4EC2F